MCNLNIQYTSVMLKINIVLLKKHTFEFILKCFGLQKWFLQVALDFWNISRVL